MSTSPARYLRYTLAAFGLILILLALFVNGSLANLVELAYPGSALWTHAALLGLEVLALLWFWKGLFRGKKHLLLMDEDSPEARQNFARELARRMDGNPHIRKAGLRAQSADDEEYLGRCLALLREKADEEIRNNAKRIFLATALSQNGRIDALVMFVSLCRLVWRVSAVYNQRPHPREVASLYWAVISTAFLALSIEELDIPTEITVGFGEAFHAMAPAGMTASIPFAGKALQTFTAAAIDGAANCYLALRAGIITRNAYAYAAAGAERPGRAAVFKEAGGLLLTMSHEVVDKLAATLAAGLGEAARSAGGMTARAGRGVACAVGAGAGKLASGTVQAGKDVAGAVGGGAEKLADSALGAGKGLALGAGRLAAGAAGAARSAGSGVLRAGSGVARAGGRAGGKVKDAVRGAAASGWRVIRKPFGKS